MYIRLLNFRLNGDKKAEVRGIMNNIVPMIRKQNGCRDCMFLMHEADNRYALLVTWESQQDADNAAPIIGPQLLPALNKISSEAVVPMLYEVYQPETAIA